MGLFGKSNLKGDIFGGVKVLMTIIQPQLIYMLAKRNVIPNVVLQEHPFATFEDFGQFLSEQIDYLTIRK